MLTSLSCAIYPRRLQTLAQKLLEPMPMGEPTSDQLIEDLVHAVLHLRETRISESIDQLHFLQEELQEQGEMGRGPLPRNGDPIHPDPGAPQPGPERATEGQRIIFSLPIK